MLRYCSLVLLILLVSGFFAYSVQLRSPSFGKFAFDANGGGVNTNWVSLSYYSLLFEKNWYKQGAIHMNFALQSNPPSIEKSKWVTLYGSFSPAYLLPFHLFSKLSGIEPNLRSLMGMSLFFHFCIALALSCILYFLVVESVGPWLAFVHASVVAMLSCLLAPSLYYYQSAYWPDLVGLLPFFLTIGAECSGKKRLVPFLLFVGILVDWLNFFLAVAIFLLRWWKEPGSRRITKVATFWYKPAIAVALFLLHAHLSHAHLWDKLTERMGVSAEHRIGIGVFIKNFYGRAFLYELDYSGLALLLSSLLVSVGFVFTFRRKSLPALPQFTLLTLLSVFFHSFVFHEHYYHHSYNLAKYGFLLAALPFFCIPVFFSSKISRTSIRWGIALLVLVAAIFTTKKSLEFYEQKPRPELSVYSEKLNAASLFLEKHTHFDDVVFSQELALDPAGANATAVDFVAVAYKYVYQANTLGDVKKRNAEFLKAFQPIRYLEPHFWFLSEGAPPKSWLQHLNLKNKISDGRFILTEIKGPISY